MKKEKELPGNNKLFLKNPSILVRRRRKALMFLGLSMGLLIGVNYLTSFIDQSYLPSTTETSVSRDGFIQMVIDKGVLEKGEINESFFVRQLGIGMMVSEDEELKKEVEKELFSLNDYDIVLCNDDKTIFYLSDSFSGDNKEGELKNKELLLSKLSQSLASKGWNEIEQETELNSLKEGGGSSFIKQKGCYRRCFIQCFENETSGSAVLYVTQ